ncbi:MAG: ATP-dependent sacrificial sulfur transferase LarE [Actinobacteria bacterium]|nr:ATP-dependent sacrificial sulfur transferase LarE [Actinomycetota bacterium]
MGQSLEQKIATAEERISKLGSALTALSGGVDSSLLLALAVRALGPNRVVAVTALGPVESEEDARSAEDLAKLVGSPHRVIHLDPFEIPEFPLNTPQRCYFCRRQLFAALEKIRVEEGLATILEGAIADDATDYRPGSRAALESAVGRPLAEAGFTKEEVRMASRLLGLPTAEKPASPCLASRFPYGQAITVEGLEMVARAESLLHSRGFPVVRVRHHGPVARIEVPSEQIPRVSAEPLRSEITAALKEMGYAYVSLDLEGFRSGSLNEVLPKRGNQVLPERLDEVVPLSREDHQTK